MKTTELKKIILEKLKATILNKQYTLTFEDEKYTFWWSQGEEEVSEGLINHLLRNGKVVAVKRDYGLFFIPPRDSNLPSFTSDLTVRKRKLLVKHKSNSQISKDMKSTKLSLFN